MSFPISTDIFGQLKWLVKQVKLLIFRVTRLEQASGINPNNPCYLEIISTTTFPYNSLIDYNLNTGYTTPFTALVTTGSIQRLYGGSGIDLASLFAGNAGVTSIIDNCGVVTSIDAVGFGDCSSLAFVSLPSITTIPTNVFRHCNELTIALLPKAVTAGDYAFTNTSIVDVSLPLLTSIGVHGFDNIVSLKTVSLPKLTILPKDSFANCTALTTINLSSVTDLGGTPQDDGVFVNITGNTISLTVPVAMSTIDGGNPDGDIVYLDSGNTLTVNYV